MESRDSSVFCWGDQCRERSTAPGPQADPDVACARSSGRSCAGGVALSWKEATIEAVNAIAYATPYHRQWFCGSGEAAKVHPRFLDLHVEVVSRKTLPKPYLASLAWISTDSESADRQRAKRFI